VLLPEVFAPNSQGWIADTLNFRRALRVEAAIQSAFALYQPMEAVLVMCSRGST
jgi:hypothetical protein